MDESLCLIIEIGEEQEQKGICSERDGVVCTKLNGILKNILERMILGCEK
jgi:hypothetical protein